MRVLTPTALDLGVPQAPVARLSALRRAVHRAGVAELDILEIGPGQQRASRRIPKLGSVLWRMAALRSVRSRLRHAAVDALLLVDLDPVLLAGISWLARRRGVPLFVEVTEYPDQVLGGGRMRPLAVRAYWWALRGAAGMFTITDTLRNEVAARLGQTAMVVPGFVDTAEFDPLAPVDEPLTLMYAGSLSEAKDGVRTLVRAFSVAVATSDAGPRLRIVAGGHSAQEHVSLQSVIAEVGMEKYVTVEGPYPRSRMPEVLASAAVLVMPRPPSRQATGGFPTKLGEYLATGRAVIATRVGPVENILEDGVSALLVEAGSQAALADAIARALSDDGLRRSIGAAGRRVAEEELEVDRHARRMIEFMASRMVTA